MLNQEAFARLARLINNLHLCTGIKFALMDSEGSEIYTSSDRGPFCHAIREEALPQCCSCDKEAVRHVLRTHAPYKYLCHAGLYEVAVPLQENGETVAIVLFGQMLDDAPRDAQWERVKQCCRWYSQQEELHQAFLHLRRISPEQMAACMEIVRACVSMAQLPHAQRDDAARLKMYVDAHYAEPIDTDGLARVLHVGKTKLYAICHERFHETPMQLVTRVRVEAAQELLSTTQETVKSVSQTVGFVDQNYFAKVFKKSTGLSPTHYREKTQN